MFVPTKTSKASKGRTTPKGDMTINGKNGQFRVNESLFNDLNPTDEKNKKGDVKPTLHLAPIFLGKEDESPLEIQTQNGVTIVDLNSEKHALLINLVDTESQIKTFRLSNSTGASAQLADLFASKLAVDMIENPDPGDEEQYVNPNMYLKYLGRITSASRFEKALEIPEGSIRELVLLELTDTAAPAVRTRKQKPAQKLVDRETQPAHQAQPVEPAASPQEKVSFGRPSHGA